MRAQEIAKRLAESSEAVVSYLLPNGKKVGHSWCVGSIEGEVGQSLRVCLSGEKQGKWCDFATDEKGDLLDLWTKIHGVSVSVAIKEIKQWLGLDTKIILTAAFGHRRIEQFSGSLNKTWQSVEKESAIGCYLIQERKLLLSTIQRFQLGQEKNDIVFPFFHDQDVFQTKYLSLTRENNKKLIRVEKNSETGLFGWQALTGFEREIAITEGEIDAMSLSQYAIPALSVPFGGGAGNKQQWISYEFDRLAHFDVIYLCLDDDEPGHLAAQTIAERLGSYRCRRVILPYKDANACLQANVDPAIIQSCFSQASTCDPIELKEASYFTPAVIDLMTKPEQSNQGINPPWSKSQQKIAFRSNELSLWTGINGHGKSQFLGQIILESIRQDAKVCIASLELKPVRLLQRLIRQASGIVVPTVDYIQAISAWFQEKLWLFDLVGSAKGERLLEVFEYAHRRYAVNVFVIDSLMKCGLAEDDYNGQKLFVERLCDFKNQYNCHIHLVTHPRKGINEDQVPGKLDIKGSGALSDLADNCFTVWRNKIKEKKLLISPDSLEQQGQPDCLWFCDKQRNGEWEGKISLWFDRNSWQYLEYQNQRPIH